MPSELTLNAHDNRGPEIEPVSGSALPPQISGCGSAQRDSAPVSRLLTALRLPSESASDEAQISQCSGPPRPVFEETT